MKIFPTMTFLTKPTKKKKNKYIENQDKETGQQEKCMKALQSCSKCYEISYKKKLLYRILRKKREKKNSFENFEEQTQERIKYTRVHHCKKKEEEDERKKKVE